MQDYALAPSEATQAQQYVAMTKQLSGVALHSMTIAATTS